MTISLVQDVGQSFSGTTETKNNLSDSSTLELCKFRLIHNVLWALILHLLKNMK